MDYEDNPGEYLASVSPRRLSTVKYPKQWWKGRARCFRLFQNGRTPSQISPRQCGVTRRTLYRYYQDWKIVRAKNALVMLRVRQQIAREREAQRSGVIEQL